MLDHRTKPFKHDYVGILERYDPATPLVYIAEKEGININTLMNIVRRFDLRPRRRRGIVDGKREVLHAMLDAVNEIRTRDLTGPEACGEITDLIYETLERM